MAKNPQPLKSSSKLGAPTLLLTAAIAVILLFLWQVKPMLTAFVIGLVVAYLLNPLVSKLDNLGLGRMWGSLLPVALFYATALLLVGLAIPSIVKQGVLFVENAPNTVDALQGLVPKLENALGLTLSVGSFVALAGKFGQQALQVVVGSLDNVLGGALAVGNLLTLLLVTPLVTFYLMEAWPRLTREVQSLIPPKHKKETLALLGRIDNKLAGFVRGQLLVCLCQGIIYGLGFWLIGVKMGWLLGLATGVLTFIPVVGGMVGMGLTLLVAMIQFQFDAWVPYALILAVFAFGSTLESFYLTPKLVGDKVGLHPIWVIFALMAGGQMAGIVGMLIAVPVAAVVAELLPLVAKLWKNSPYYR